MQATKRTVFGLLGLLLALMNWQAVADTSGTGGANFGDIRLIDFKDPGFLIVELGGQQLNLPFYYRTISYSDLQRISFPISAKYEVGERGQQIIVDEKIEILVFGSGLIDHQDGVCQDQASSMAEIFSCVGANRAALKGQFDALTGYLNEIELGDRLTDMIERHNQRTLEQLKSAIDLIAEVNTEFPDGGGSSISRGYMLNAIYGNALRPLEMVIRASPAPSR